VSFELSISFANIVLFKWGKWHVIGGKVVPANRTPEQFGLALAWITASFNSVALGQD
jgi:hypothetical protein